MLQVKVLAGNVIFCDDLAKAIALFDPFTLLCRFYEKAFGFISKSYALQSTLRPVETNMRPSLNECPFDRNCFAFGAIGRDTLDFGP